MAAARDFKHRAQGSGAATRSRRQDGARPRAAARPADERGPRQSSRRGRATLFALGLLLGFTAGIGVMVFDVPERVAALNQSAPLATDGHGAPAAGAGAEAQAEVEFGFYDDLAELVVVLDAQDLEAPTAAPEPPRPPPPAPPVAAAPTPAAGAAPVRQAVPSTSQPQAPRADAAPRTAAPRTAAPRTAAPSAATNTAATAPAAGGGTRYLIQVASFRREADAEKTRATLGFAGLRARIVSVSLDDGSQRHRVQLEPVKGEARLKAVRDALKLNGFSEPLVVRVKKG